MFCSYCQTPGVSVENQNTVQAFQMPSTNPGQQYQTSTSGQSYQIPPPNPGQGYQNPVSIPGQPYQMPPGQPNQLPPGLPNQMPPGQHSQMPPGQINQMPTGQLNQFPLSQPNQMTGQPYEAKPLVPGQSLQAAGSSQPYQTAMPTSSQAYQMRPQNTSQTYQVPPANPVTVVPHQGLTSKPASGVYQTPAPGQPYQVPASYPGQPYQNNLPTNPEQVYQLPASNPSQLHPDTRALTGQPMQMQIQPPHTSQAYPTPTSASGQPFQVPPQVQAHRPYQAPPQSPIQGPPQSPSQTYFQAPGQASYQPYQTPVQPPGQSYQGQVQHPDIKPYQVDNMPNKMPIPASIGSTTPQQHQQQVQPVMPASSMPPGIPPPNQYQYQPNYYSSPPAQNSPGSRALKPESQGNVPSPVVGQPFQTLPAHMAQRQNQQTTDGRSPSYTSPAPPQAPQWVPPFASPAHTTSPYHVSQPVSYASEQSVSRQPQSQNPTSGYPPGSYSSGAGYALPGQVQPVLANRQPYVQSPSHVYGPSYHQPGLTDPRSQYIARRSASTDAKINSIDTLLCRAEELEPKVLSFSGRRGQLNNLTFYHFFQS